MTYQRGDGVHLGALLEDGHTCVDLQAEHVARTGAASPHLGSLLSLIEGDASALDMAKALAVDPRRESTVPLSRVRLLAPLPRPPQIRDFLSFEAHLLNARRSMAKLNAQLNPSESSSTNDAASSVWYRQPLYYKCNRFSVCGDGQDIVWPSYSSIIDYEVEIAAIIGKPGRNITEADASKHIFGYTIFNDLTARDAQCLEMSGRLGPAKGKDFDDSIVMGPWVVTSDELPNPYALRMRAWVNGELWTDGSSQDMHWRFEDMIAHVSRGETLYGGEVIGSGTVGLGCGLELGRFLKDGDVIDVEIENLGRLSNRIKAPHVTESFYFS